MTAWNPLDLPIDKAVVAGRETPGLVEIIGASAPRRWDERKGYGLSGATVVYRGQGLAKFTVRLRLYTTQDWDDWHAWKSLVAAPPPGKRAKALDIVHPLLADLEITAIVVNEVMQPEQSEDGVWQIDIKVTQFRSPKFSLAKPEAAQATPVDPVDQKIEQLSKQFQELAR
jgi:hypothetical protein